MTITNYNDSFVKIKSSFLDDVIANPSNYSSVSVVGSINCCTDPCGDLKNTEIITTLSTNKWYVNSAIVNILADNIVKLYMQSNISLVKTNALVTPILITNTTSLKTQIDAWFTSIGVTSSVTVALDSNYILSIANLPANFRIHSLEYGPNAHTLVFGYGSFNSKVFLGTDAIYIDPLFFGSTTLRDGVYLFTVKYIKTAGSGLISETNAGFVDVTTKCKVATKLNGLIQEAESKLEQTSTVIHLLHYGLVNGSNCGCNYAEMCTVYKELINLLSNTLTDTDCGC